MDPYGLVRKRVQSSRGRFWTWLDRQSSRAGFTFVDSETLKSEGLLLLDQAAWITHCPANWKRWLPLRRGGYGVVAITCQRILIHSDAQVLLEARSAAESFQDIRVDKTGDSNAQVRISGHAEFVNGHGNADYVISVESRNAQQFVDLICAFQADPEAWANEHCFEFAPESGDERVQGDLRAAGSLRPTAK